MGLSIYKNSLKEIVIDIEVDVAEIEKLIAKTRNGVVTGMSSHRLAMRDTEGILLKVKRHPIKKRIQEKIA